MNCIRLRCMRLTHHGAVIQKIGDAAQMTILPCSVSDLRNVLTSGTKNDAMNQGKQVISLGFRKLQFKSQNELDDRQVEGYHG